MNLNSSSVLLKMVSGDFKTRTFFCKPELTLFSFIYFLFHTKLNVFLKWDLLSEGTSVDFKIILKGINFLDGLLILL
jgi:hypothetical protein